MLHRFAAGLLTLLGLTLLAGCFATVSEPALEVSTSEGDFIIALDAGAAPDAVGAVATLAAEGFYDGTVIHRAQAGELVALGGYVRSALLLKTAGDPIPSEAENGLTNTRGTIAMARTSDPDSATSQFFINLADNVDLDTTDSATGYTVFGRIISGLNVADAIGAVPVGEQDGLTGVPVRDIAIQNARRITLTGVTGVGLAFDTSFGTLEFALDDTVAPQTVANFLAYVDAGFYENTLFHRAVAGVLIQGGGYTRELTQKAASAPAANESRNGLKNVRGTVAVMFSEDHTDNAATFMVNLADNPQFDASGSQLGFAVFGRVIEGIDIVDRIAALPTADRGDLADVPVQDVIIDRVRLFTRRLAADPADAAQNIADNAPGTLLGMLQELIRTGIYYAIAGG